METNRTDLSGHTILIVEYQPIPALNLQVALEDAGAAAIVARGPHEAMARLRQVDFSAALIDPRQRTLMRDLQQRSVLVLLKPATRWELLARLAMSSH
jgi:CheY-like chemotaxis protein